MKWKQFLLADTDTKARSHILRSLSVGAVNHTLSQTVKTHFSDAKGSIVLVALDSIDLDSITDYGFAASYGGKGLTDALGPETMSQAESTLGGLATILGDHLRSSKKAVVLFENLHDTRTAYLTNWRPRESRILFYGEEVYHVLTSEDNTFESIETAIRESSNHWSTGVCSFCDTLPQSEIAADAFFEDIVVHMTGIFTNAMDDESYLVWKRNGGLAPARVS